MSSGDPSRFSAMPLTSARWPSAPSASHWRSVFAIGSHETGSDAVDGDLPGTELVSELARQTDERGLGGGIGLDAGEADREPRTTRDVDDATEASGLHPRRHSLTQIERAADIHGEDRVPVIGRYRFQRPADLPEHAAGIVHQNVDAPARQVDFLHECVNGIALRDIDRADLARSARAEQRRRVSSSSVAMTSMAQTCAPRSASAMLMARPKPWAAPVTIAVLPVKSVFMRIRTCRSAPGKSRRTSSGDPPRCRETRPDAQSRVWPRPPRGRAHDRPDLRIDLGLALAHGKIAIDARMRLGGVPVEFGQRCNRGARSGISGTRRETGGSNR